MTQPPNPITKAFRAVRRDPAVFLIEILWHWSFALIAFFLLFIAGLMLLGPLNIGPSFVSAWRSHDNSKIGIVLLTIVLRPGNRLLVALIVLPIVIALIWSLLVAAARRITVRRLSAASPLRFRLMLVLQILLALAYFAMSDFIYVSRMAAYLALAAAHGERDVAELLEESSRPHAG